MNTEQDDAEGYQVKSLEAENMVQDGTRSDQLTETLFVHQAMYKESKKNQGWNGRAQPDSRE